MSQLPDIEKEFGDLRSFICKCHELKINGSWRGSSYKYHPCGVIRGGIKLVDHWNVNDYRSISIAENPEALWHEPFNHSTVEGPANPKPKDCEEIIVWNHGKWVKDGPWVEKIYSLFKELKSEIDIAQEKKDQFNALEKERLTKEKEERENKLANSWK